jgi:hypothetical protein
MRNCHDVAEQLPSAQSLLAVCVPWYGPARPTTSSISGTRSGQNCGA